MKTAYLYVAFGLVANLVTVYCMNRTYDGWKNGTPTWSWGMLLNYAGIAVPIVATQFLLVLAKSEISLTGAIAVLISAVLIASMVMESFAAGRAPSGLQWVLAAVMIASVWAFLLVGAPEKGDPGRETSRVATDGSFAPAVAASGPPAVGPRD